MRGIADSCRNTLAFLISGDDRVGEGGELRPAAAKKITSALVNKPCAKALRDSGGFCNNDVLAHAHAQWDAKDWVGSKKTASMAHDRVDVTRIRRLPTLLLTQLTQHDVEQVRAS